MSQNKNKFGNACLCISNYALLLYLLIVDEETAKNDTYYVFGKAIDKKVLNKITPNIFVPSRNGNSIKDVVMRFWDKMKLRNFWDDKPVDLNTCTFYAQDHAFLSILLRNVDYKLLSDCPNYFTINMQEGSSEYRKLEKNKHSLAGKLQRLMYGDVAVSTFGNNSHCKEIYLTEENISPVLKGKLLHEKSMQELWNESTESKKRFIENIFDVDREELKCFDGKVIFFSQPLVEDGNMSEAEYVEYIKQIFGQYDTSKLLIKTHPRDKFDYQSLFPEIQIYTKPINAQLLVLMGLNVDRVATICSSAVYTFPESVEIDWYANSNPIMKAYCNGTIKPFRKYNDIIL